MRFDGYKHPYHVSNQSIENTQVIEFETDVCRPM